MLTDFNLDQFRKELWHLCTEFSKEHTLTNSTYKSLFAEHEKYIDDHSYHIGCKTNASTDDKMYNKIRLIYQIHGVSVIEGDFDTATKRFITDTTKSTLYKSYAEEDRLNDWHEVAEAIEECFVVGLKFFMPFLNGNFVEPIVVYDKDDVIGALNELFKAYSSFPQDVPNGQEVVARYNCITTSFSCDDHSRYGKCIRVHITYDKNNHTKHLYAFDYSLSSSTFLAGTGTPPDGFEEGFAQFRLLGSLMS